MVGQTYFFPRHGNTLILLLYYIKVAGIYLQMSFLTVLQNMKGRLLKQACNW